MSERFAMCFRHDVDMTNLVRVGYWRSALEPDLPHPSSYVDLAWNEEECNVVVDYLRGGLPVLHMLGFSPCRMCDLAQNGSAELTDGAYLWPEGLAHYVERHRVRLPGEFERHVLQRWETLEAAAVASRQVAPSDWLRMTQ
ncbi:hypothetical protein [Nocardioides jejuensis]|uniref:Uncharacterized protein n=1 Tax=Nocardioides jejuensis TaxID=2502782 RepID=A0A4R1CHA5_9ACTN|nr:hypothetical protein [Nocardioides jejuensis]TCJ30784.1 hypothetical protein EPD65_01740 [Nocardioides jejuensis]